jgi:hypothetical protein
LIRGHQSAVPIFDDVPGPSRPSSWLDLMIGVLDSMITGFGFLGFSSVGSPKSRRWRRPCVLEKSSERCAESWVGLFTPSRALPPSFTPHPPTMTRSRVLLALSAALLLLACASADPCTLKPTFGNAYIGHPQKYVPLLPLRPSVTLTLGVVPILGVI